jgi:hypothetical protein
MKVRSISVKPFRGFHVREANLALRTWPESYTLKLQHITKGEVRNMTNRKKLILAATAVFATAFAVASPLAAKPAVDVKFDHPEKFTDVKDSSMGTEKGRDAILDTLKEYIQTRAAKRLSDGQTLTITFTNIDLAGEFEPERGPSASDVRIMKSVYAPRLDFSYKLVDANGTVVKEGEEKLRDMNYQTRTNPINASEPLHIEEDMLNDWIHSALPKPKK